MKRPTIHKRTARRVLAATAAVAVLAGTGMAYANGSQDTGSSRETHRVTPATMLPDEPGHLAGL